MTATIKQRMALYDRMQRVLSDAMRERGQRMQVGNWGDGYETAWAHHERHLMLREVNRARAEQGHDPVDVATLRRVEQLACGHVDYFKKFTLYCAELALDVSAALRDGGQQ